MAGEDDDGQPLVAARRAQILDAAAQVFAAKGFHRATIKEIARAAGVADGTIYTYFQNKDDLLIGLLDRLNESDRRPADLGEAASVDLRTFFTAYLRHRLQVLQDNLELFRAVLPELLVNPALRERYHAEVVAPTMRLGEQLFDQQIAEGMLRPMDSALLARVNAGTVLGLLLLQLLGDEQLALRTPEVAELVTTVFFEGIER
jgi:AcrR family transcriptional regulator